ncbi:CPCC family cysteine-rich protein [Polycladomyces subterraneus]|uniref:CPCC family cysteine-rich protein n=1 Tax=Polycladomyces subterraneus TaxID=1016997 RepID=A0ABT8IP24_9BACL|nr:CPCC family cysteine-rich protein [Polycladomyces subterraneus]MDN4594546.1 CPCC family cysteine-rich protein [Polycladomyces subterraneus]
MLYSCLCCGFLTYPEEPGDTYNICPVCYWEDDPVQNDDPTFSGGANSMSLLEARDNFRKYSAISLEFVKRVRKPLPEEYPDNC